jgi:NADPH:quinone reductase-like Zn-dependent oxidoreductase
VSPGAAGVPPRVRSAGDHDVALMRALQVDRFEGFPSMAISEVEEPVPGPGETLVDVCAVALSRSDVAVLIDRATDSRAPCIPGISVAGVVRHGGRFPPGTRVAIDPYVPCGRCERCSQRAGCSRPEVVGRDRPGGLAERVAVPSSQIVPLPRTMSFEQAAAVAASGAIAAKILIDDAGVVPGERVLLTGSTGSLGLTVLQLARAMGCEVVALVSRPDRVGLALDAGAHHAVTMTLDGAPPALADVGGQVDVLVHLGRDAGWLRSLVACLRPDGRLVMRRVRPGSQVDIDIGELASRGYRLVGSLGSGRVGLAEAIGMLSSVPTPAIIDSVLPLSELVAGFESLAGRRNRGAVVLSFGT